MGQVAEILASETSRRIADLCTETVLNNTALYPELIELLRSGKTSAAWRAAWVAEFIDSRNQQLILPYLDTLAQEFSTYKTDGHQRILLKIFANHMQNLGEEALGTIADKCFNILLLPKTANAVLVNAMEFLFQLSKQFPELKPELKALIEQLLDEKGHSAAIQSRSRKIIKALEHENFVSKHKKMTQ